MKYEFVYDTYGNNTLVKIVSGNVSIQSQADYTDDGNRLEWTRDALDKQTTYCYNENTNVLEWVQYPNDTTDSRTHYDYDDMFRIAIAAADVSSGSALTATYTYDDDLLMSITTGSTTYSFEYGDFSLREKISIGNRELATYAYTEEDYFLSRLTYGNGGTVSYEYDQQGRVTRETFGDGTTVTYDYDNTGALATVTDSATGIKTTYYYDLIDRMVKYVESGTGLEHSVQYGYDTDNNLTQVKERIGEDMHVTDYSYDADNRVNTMAKDGFAVDYDYDAYGRLSTITASQGSDYGVDRYYFYQTPGTGFASAQVVNYQADTRQFCLDVNLAYDDNGNITSVSYGSNQTTYAYDSANQLIRENNSIAGKTWVWEYDDAGNILKKLEHHYTTGALETPYIITDYSYSDPAWGDLLTCWDGNEFIYDEIGNLLSDQNWTFTWQNGRELASMSNGATTWSYTYDANGMRKTRTNGTDTYTYLYNGSQLVQMSKGSDTLHFYYSANGTPVAVKHNGTLYYYVTTLQGDVLMLLDSAGNELVTYTYDAWGNLLEIGGTMASTLGTLNPLTYRSYTYDHETRLYYLQTRYYNPEVGRFISADTLVATGQGMLGNNMFAYCLNNPVCRKDISGATSVACHSSEDVNHADDDKEFAGGNMSNGNPGSSTQVIGGGHGNEIHKGRIENLIEKLKNSGEYLVIYGNRALKTAGLVGNQRPDVIAVASSGKIEVWEFASPSQAFGSPGYFTLQAKIDIMATANPSVEFHAIIHW